MTPSCSLLEAEAYEQTTQIIERNACIIRPAEDLLDQALGSGRFEVLALFGVGEDRLWTGEEARERLEASYR